MDFYKVDELNFDNDIGEGKNVAMPKRAIGFVS